MDPRSIFGDHADPKAAGLYYALPDPSEFRLLRDGIAKLVGHTKKHWLGSAVEKISRIIAEPGAKNADLGAETTVTTCEE